MPLRGFDDDDELDDEDEFGGPRHTRHIEDLSEEEKQVLDNIKSPQDIKSCQVANDWVDDHIVCAGVILNGVEFGAWWCGWEIAAAFMYWEHPNAKKEIIAWLNSQAEDISGDEITPDDLPQRPQ